MKKVIDTNFARAILVLVGAIVIFSFWFLTNSMIDDYDQIPVSVTPNSTSQNSPNSTSDASKQQAIDPVLKEVEIDNIILETPGDIQGLGDLSEIEEIDFTDVNF